MGATFQKFKGNSKLYFVFQAVWQKILKETQVSVLELNKKIDKYNYLVPIMSKQMVHFPLKSLAKKIMQQDLQEDQNHTSTNTKSDSLRKSNLKEEGGLRSIISVFKGR